MAVTRITGLTSGFDTDTMVKELINIEQMRVDNEKGKKEVITWKQEQYREITKSLQDFQSNYFDILKGDKNITSASSFAKFSSSVKAGSTDVTAVSVVGTSSASSLKHTINSITQLATKDKFISDELGFNEIKSGSLNFGTIPSNVKFNLTIDGVTKTIEFASSSLATQDASGLRDKLNTEISSKFGTDYGNLVSLTATDQIKFEKSGTNISILEDTASTDTMTFLGVTSGESTSSYGGKSLNTLLSITDADLANMTINGKSLSELGVTQNSTISELENKVNTSTVGAKIYFSSLNDKFEITSDKEGSINALTLSADLKTKFKLDDINHQVALNAKLNIDGEDVIKSTNSFDLGGVQYTLNSTYTDVTPINVNLTRDTTSVMDNIKGFVEAYNKIVEDVTNKLGEKSYRTYKPLTEEQRRELSDNEVELWDAKAKSGHLRNDSILTKMLSDMRSSLYSSVKDAGISLTEIGISTSSNYKENGKLIIDETKLKSALDNKFDSVVKLFTSDSDKKYLDGENRLERYNESGLGDRLLDIIKDNSRTTRDDNGKKGFLVEKAGIFGDINETGNALGVELGVYDKKIEALLEYLQDQESRYYTKFSAMESALSEMQNQSNSLAGLLG